MELLLLSLQLAITNKLYVFFLKLLYLTLGHFYFWMIGFTPILSGFIVVLIIFLLFFQGNAYTSMPFYAMRRNISKKNQAWEPFDFNLTIDDTLISKTYKDDYQSWKELGDRSNTFYQIRSKHYQKHIQDQYTAANRETIGYDKLPICEPYYQQNILSYDLEEDMNDLMPSIDSLCQNDASSVLWQLRPDALLIRWTNTTAEERLDDRTYRKMLSKGPRYFVSRQRHFYASLEKPIFRFPDILRALRESKKRARYITKSHPGYPINKKGQKLMLNWQPNFDSITTRLDLYPHLIRYGNDNENIYQDINFMSFKTALKSIFAFTLFIRYFRKLNFLIRQSLYSEVEHDPFFLRLLNIHNLAYPFLKLKLGLKKSTKTPKTLFKIEKKNTIKKSKRYVNLIKSSRAHLLRDMFIQTSHTLPNDLGLLSSPFFIGDDPYSDYDFIKKKYPFISSKRQYCEDRIQAQSALLPLQFEYEEDRNIELFNEDNVEPFSYELLSAENPSLLDNYEIIVEGIDNFQDGESKLTDPFVEFLRLVQTYYIIPAVLIIWIKVSSLILFISPFLFTDIYTNEQGEDRPIENLKYPATLVVNNKKRQTFFTDDYIWLYYQNEHVVIDEECYEDIVYDIDLDSYEDGWVGTQTDNDFFFDMGLKKFIRPDNILAEMEEAGSFFKSDEDLFEGDWLEDHYYTYTFLRDDVPKSYVESWETGNKRPAPSLVYMQYEGLLFYMGYFLGGDYIRFHMLSELRKKPAMHSFLPRGYVFDLVDEDVTTEEAWMFQDPEDVYAIHNIMENYSGFELDEGDSFGHEESIYIDESVQDGSGPECYADIDGASEFEQNFSYTPFPAHVWWTYDVGLQYPTIPMLELINIGYNHLLITDREDDLEEFLIMQYDDEIESLWYEGNGEVDDFDLTDTFVVDEEFGEDVPDPFDEGELNETIYTSDHFEPLNRSVYEDASDDPLEDDEEDEEEDHDLMLLEEERTVQKEFKKGEATFGTRVLALLFNMIRKVLKF